MPTVLVTLPVPAALLAQFQSQLPPGTTVAAVPSLAWEDFTRHAADADILVGSTSRAVDAAFLAAAPKARFVQWVGAGYDAVDIAAAAAAGVPVAYTPGMNAASVAEHTILLMLAVLKQFRTMEQTAREGGWVHPPAVQATIADLSSQTVGLVGMGTIGQATAERLRPFGCRLLYWSRRRLGDAEEARLGVEYLALEDLLAASTIVSLHIALVDETRHLIDAATLARMRPGAVLVNTGRGDLVDETALRDALERGHLDGAALDVLHTEGPGGNVFADLPNVLVTPHTAGVSRDSVGRAMVMSVANIRRVLEGQDPLYLIPGSPVALPASAL